MPPYYIGGAVNPFSGFGKPSTLPTGPDESRLGQNPDDRWPWLPKPPMPIRKRGTQTDNPIGPITSGPFTSAGTTAPPPAPGNVLGAQAVRATGDPKGYDPSYLQNLATAIGGLFSRPEGNLSFNPLGNLSEISPSSGMEGNAPMPGLPSTWLQDALNGLSFSFTPKAPATPQRPRIGDRGGGEDGRRGGGRRFSFL